MTLEDLDALPDDGVRHELQAGLLLSEPLPGARHGRIAMRIAYRIEEHVRRHRLGVVSSKVADYLAAGSRLVWVVDSEARTVTAYASLLAPVVTVETGVLRAEELLPGFELRVGEIFEY
jgi:Uma2 family endonuclease